MKTQCTTIPLLAAVFAADAEHPNIVLIMADDLGMGDVSHHTGTFQ